LVTGIAELFVAIGAGAEADNPGIARPSDRTGQNSIDEPVPNDFSALTRSAPARVVV
jgi:hypothetical protein